MAGYRLNNGEMNGLTRLQQIAIICMKNIHRVNSLENKAFLVVE